jgi:hypothetical protein
LSSHSPKSLPYGMAGKYRFVSINEKEFVLLCKESGREVKLVHADITHAPCDSSWYYTMHKQYYGRFRSFWKCITMKEIRSIEFVRVWIRNSFLR